MKANENFFICFIRVLIIKDYISSYSIAKAIVEFSKIALTTFTVTIIFSLIMLTTNEGFDLVLLKASEEFLQFTGLKLFSYAILFLVPIGFICYRCNVFIKIIYFFINSISNIGFVIIATLAGALPGMILADFITLGHTSSPTTILKLYFFIFLLAFLFYGSPKLFLPKGREIIESWFGKHTTIVTLVAGVITFPLIFYGFSNELWPEVFR